VVHLVKSENLNLHYIIRNLSVPVRHKRASVYYFLIQNCNPFSKADNYTCGDLGYIQIATD